MYLFEKKRLEPDLNWAFLEDDFNVIWLWTCNEFTNDCKKLRNLIMEYRLVVTTHVVSNSLPIGLYNVASNLYGKICPYFRLSAFSFVCPDCSWHLNAADIFIFSSEAWLYLLWSHFVGLVWDPHRSSASLRIPQNLAIARPHSMYLKDCRMEGRLPVSLMEIQVVIKQV